MAAGQQPVLVRGFDLPEFGINPSMLDRQQQQQLGNESHYGAFFGRQGSMSPTTHNNSAFVIPHMRAWGQLDSHHAGASTDELVDGLQQSLASMDSGMARHSQSHAHSYVPRASSAASSRSSASGGAGHPSSEMASGRPPPPSDPRAQTYSFHSSYRPSLEQYHSNSTNSLSDRPSSTSSAYSQSLPPNLVRHNSTSYLHANHSNHINGSHSGADTPKSPLELYHSPAINAILQMHGSGSGASAAAAPSSSLNSSSVTSSGRRNSINSYIDPASSYASSTGASSTAPGSSNNAPSYYPFAQPDAPMSNMDGRLSSYHRHQAHAQSNSYSSAFDPVSFLGNNGLNSPTLVRPPSLSNLQEQGSSVFAQQPQQQQQQQQQPRQTAQRPSPTQETHDLHLQPARRSSSAKRSGSTDAANNSRQPSRGRTDSPQEDGISQSRGRTTGRTPSSGKAPSSQRSSRSRNRGPTYSRTISPAGNNALRNSTSSNSPAQGHGGHAACNTSSNLASSVSNADAGADSAPTASQSQAAPSMPNAYPPQMSPYMPGPGYPGLHNASGSEAAGMAGLPTASDSAALQSVLAASTPTNTAAAITWLKMQEAIHQHQQQQGGNTMLPQNPMTLDILSVDRKFSDSSTFEPSSAGPLGFLNSPGTFTGPLPLPHQEGFRSSAGGLPDNWNQLMGMDTGMGSNGAKNDDSTDMDAKDVKGKPGDDKRKKRRESHNAVERRRRDNINDRIGELAALIPEVLLDPAGLRANGEGGKDESGAAGQDGSSSFPAPISQATFTPAQLAQQQASNKPNKGIILTKSVEYIRYLQQLVSMQAERNHELEMRLRAVEGANQGLMPNGLGGGGNQFAPVVSPTTLAMNHARSLPTLHEGAHPEESIGLSHKRDQFTARRSDSRNSIHEKSANSPPSAGLQQSMEALQQNWHDASQSYTANGPVSLDDFAAMNKGNGISHAQMTFDDLLKINKDGNSAIDASQTSASGSPGPSVGKMEEDDENALGMHLA